MRKKNKPRTLSKFQRDIEKFIPQYIAATGDQAWTIEKVADWAIANGLYEEPKTTAKRQLMRALSRVAREATITDENGKHVRKYHAFRLGPHQPMLWADMETINREQMNEAKTMRRDKLAAGNVKLAIDLDYFNAHHNTGDPLTFDPNYEDDIAEARQSGEYNDTPPEDD